MARVASGVADESVEQSLLLPVAGRSVLGMPLGGDHPPVARVLDGFDDSVIGVADDAQIGAQSIDGLMMHGVTGIESCRSHGGSDVRVRFDRHGMFLEPVPVVTDVLEE